VNGLLTPVVLLVLHQLEGILFWLVADPHSAAGCRLERLVAALAVLQGGRARNGGVGSRADQGNPAARTRTYRLIKACIIAGGNKCLPLSVSGRPENYVALFNVNRQAAWQNFISYLATKVQSVSMRDLG
jgi:hypothetical protein